VRNRLEPLLVSQDLELSLPKTGCLHYCVNVPGTHKLPVMIIGSAKRPEYFTSGWEPRRDARVWYTSNKCSRMDRNILAEYISFFNEEMKARGTIGWLFMDNSSTHCLQPDATFFVWEVDCFLLSGFTTQWVHNVKY
jgi:hypothetical protein